MFKLESYITPWLLSYIDQYVKLRREDFQLSLWGGDVVFYNLELRLANIQKLVPTLPIIFQSGIIHELRIHIPWIRINSEPIVVTINQIELVIVLNKERTSTNDSPLSFSNEINSDHVLIQQQQPTTPEQSNYVQTVLARILNNVHIVVNNLIIKFIEENIVISLSSRTAECYAVNQNWLKSFIELTQQDLSLRRLITLPDITLCLDKRDLNGKVHRYEVPLLSRCSFQCRIQMFYSNVYQQLNTKPIQTRLSFNCENIEVSIADNQLSMIMRLTEIIMLLINQQMHSNNEEQKKVLTNEIPSPPPPTPLPLPSPPLTTIIPSEDRVVTTDDPQAGWVSWAWSYVPSVTTLFAEDDPQAEVDNANNISIEQPMNRESSVEEQNILTMNNNNSNAPTPLLFAGIDLDRISLQYKVNILTFIEFQSIIFHLDYKNKWR
jgi:vacuolar protein sorting-associated protein 13B